MKRFKHQDFVSHEIELNLTTNGQFNNYQNMRNYIFSAQPDIAQLTYVTPKYRGIIR